MDNQISPLCIKCKMSVGTYIHYFWECRLIARFWSNVAQELSKIFSLKVRKDSGLFILSLPSKTLSLSRTDFKLCDKLLFLARRCILKQWISDKPPTVTQWYQEAYKVLPLERLTARMKGDDNWFEGTWWAFLKYLPPLLRDTVNKGKYALDWNTSAG